jgi:8-oxo-dGTP pyrophosphatase MutT (NUDIX family)
VAENDVIRAGGAVPWRSRGGRIELLLVHRPQYDDWSFPKGKCTDGEPDEACAVRELEEETSLRLTLGPELASTTYESKRGPKRVRYWLVEASGDAAAQNEVDEIAWLTPENAASRLTYARDRDVLRSALALLE